MLGPLGIPWRLLGDVGGGPWVPLGGRSLGGPRSFGCTGCVFCGFRGSLRWSLRLLVDSLGSLGGCPCGFLGGSLGILGGGPWVPLRGGKVLGVPARLAHGVDVLRGPLRVPWRVLGAPGAFLGVPWGKSVRVPACLTAQSVRLVGSFGGPLEGLGGSWGGPWALGGRPWGSPLVWLHRVHVSLGPLRVPWRVPWRVLGDPGGFLGVP